MFTGLFKVLKKKLFEKLKGTIEILAFNAISNLILKLNESSMSICIDQAQLIQIIGDDELDQTSHFQ